MQVDSHGSADRLALGIQDLSFREVQRRETMWGPHAYHRYPAKFIPQLARALITSYSDHDSLVADPFIGSGTTGVESLRLQRRFWGGDINPVAVLISEAKCHPIETTALMSAWQQLDSTLTSVESVGRRRLTNQERVIIREIDIARASADERLHYWFPDEYRESLESILRLILDLPAELRGFFLCGFSNILRRCSIWLSGSTKPQKDLYKFLCDPPTEFRRQIRDMVRRNALYWTDLEASAGAAARTRTRCTVVQADARKLPVGAGDLDLVVTSPPYATCYEYSDIHQLTQLFLQRSAGLSAADLRDRIIGSKVVSWRDRAQPVPATGTGSPSANAALFALSAVKCGTNGRVVDREVRQLRYYFLDMRAVVAELWRCVRPGGHVALVVGDSLKRGITIPTSQALTELAVEQGFRLEQRRVRAVPARVLTSTRNTKTGRFSSAPSSDGRAYPEESILVFFRP